MKRNKQKKKKRKEKKKRERERTKKEKEKEESRLASSLDLQRSDDRNSLDQEVKSIYLMRATLQEVDTFPTLAYFHSKGCLAVFSSLRGCLAGFFLLGFPVLTLHPAFSLRLVFDWET